MIKNYFNKNNLFCKSSSDFYPNPDFLIFFKGGRAFGQASGDVGACLFLGMAVWCGRNFDLYSEFQALNY